MLRELQTLAAIFFIRGVQKLIIWSTWRIRLQYLKIIAKVVGLISSDWPFKEVGFCEPETIAME